MTDSIAFKVKVEETANITDVKARLDQLADDITWRVTNEKRKYFAGTTSPATYALLEKESEKLKDQIKYIQVEKPLFEPE